MTRQWYTPTMPFSQHFFSCMRDIWPSRSPATCTVKNVFFLGSNPLSPAALDDILENCCGPCGELSLTAHSDCFSHLGRSRLAQSHSKASGSDQIRRECHNRRTQVSVEWATGQGLQQKTWNRMCRGTNFLVWTKQGPDCRSEAQGRRSSACDQVIVTSGA